MADRSFQGLLLSLCVHIVLVLLLLHAKPPPPPAEKTEVTLIENDHRDKKHRQVVTETEKQKDVFEKLKTQADLLSEYTKRVKKQMRAKEVGKTRNADEAQIPALNAQPREQKRGQKTASTPHTADLTPQPKQEEGMGLPALGANNAPQIRRAIGASSSEYIPGVQEGAFTALNTDQFTYYTFFERLKDQVGNRWTPMVRNYVSQRTQKDLEILSRQNRTTQVEIVINPQGDIVNALVSRSSGDKSLDAMGIEAFKIAAPFINPPKGMIEADGLIHIYFAWILLFQPPGFGLGGG